MTVVQMPCAQPPVFQTNAPNPKSRRRTSKKSVAEQHPDFALIDACVDFAMHTAAARAAFSADPTDNNDFGAFHDDLATSRARKSLETAIATHALTLDGLRSKASLVNIILDDLDGSPTEPWHDAFLRSLALDVANFQRISGPTDVVFKN